MNLEQAMKVMESGLVKAVYQDRETGEWLASSQEENLYRYFKENPQELQMLCVALNMGLEVIRNYLHAESEK